MPVYAHLAGASGKAIPLFKPSEEAKSAGRGLSLVGMMMSSFVVSGIAIVAERLGHFQMYLLIEITIAIGLCMLLRKKTDASIWPPAE
jgi:hypothetical protein